MLARCVIIRVHLSYSRRCTSIDPPTDTYRHNTYYLAEYGESNLTTSPVCPRERFSFYKFSSYAYPCERIGPLATPQLPCLLCLYFTFLLLKPKTPKYLPFSVCSPFLIQSHLSTPSAPRWDRHPYLSKSYNSSSRMVGYQESFIGTVNRGGNPTKPINFTAINELFW